MTPKDETTAASTEIAVRHSSDRDSLAELRAIVLGEKDAPPAEFIDESDPAEVSRQIVAQILQSNTVSDVFTVVGNTQSWRDNLDVPYELHGFRWRPSSYEEGSDVFLIVFGTDLTTGESTALTCGSANVIAQLIRAAELGQIDGLKVKLVEASKKTKRGFTPLHLVMLGSAEEAALVEVVEEPDVEDAEIVEG